jgi:two-component system sensor kinase FixL
LREFVARGELDRTIEPVSSLIADARALGMADARLNGIQVITEIGDETWTALVDRVQIQQVLVNLIRNAIEAISPSSAGLIRIIVARHGETLLFTVTDNGQGLTPEISSTIFDAFVSTKARGMGLGLSICRTIVEAHGGRIWCESPTDGGTAFHFTLPSIGSEQNDV